MLRAKRGHISRKRKCAHGEEKNISWRGDCGDLVLRLFFCMQRGVSLAPDGADVILLCVKCAEGYLFGAQQLGRHLYIVQQHEKRCSRYIIIIIFVFLIAGMCSFYQSRILHVRMCRLSALHIYKTIQHAHLILKERVSHLYFL